MRVTFITIVVCFIALSYIEGQTQLSGELRARPELRYGYKELPDSASKPALLVSQRSRLNFIIKKEKYSVGFSIQDVRVWGDEQMYTSTGVSGDMASIDLKEAWFAYQVKKDFNIKAGRQEWKYGDQRLLGARNWNQNGLSYDALLLSYKGLFRCDAGFSYNNEKEITFQDFYATGKIRTLNFLYLQKEFKEKLNIYGLYILSGMQNPRRAETVFLKNTLGGSATFKNDLVELNGNGYFQTGLNKDSTKVSAFLLSGYASLFIGPLKLTLGTDIISGQNAICTDSTYLKTDHRFDNLYGARHSFNGDMDLFSNLGSATGGGGLNDIYLNVDSKVNEKLAVRVAYHYFSLQNNVLDPESLTSPYYAMDPYLGSEVDLKLNYKIGEDISFEIGYSILKGSESFYTIRGNKAENAIPAQWVYLMITFKPVFFSTEK